MSRLDYDNPLYGITYETPEEKAAREWAEKFGIGTSGGGSTAKPTTTTSTSTYAQDSLKDKQNTLQGQPGIKSLADLQGTPGARYINSATIGLPDGSKYQLRGDGSGLWGVGFSMTKAEQGQYLAGAPVGAPAAAPGAQGAQTQGLLNPAQGVAGLMNPGTPGTITRGLTNDNGNLLNQIQVHNPGMGFNGFINKEEGQRAPGLAALGTGPAISSNLIQFSQGARGFTQDPNPMGPVSYTTPSSFNTQTGFNDQGYAVPTTVGVSYGTPSYNPLTPSSPTIPLEMAGSNVQMFRPDGSSTGFVRDAMPASNIGLAQGRDFSSLNPAAQAAATFALLDRMEGGRLSGSYGPAAPAAAPPVAYGPVGQGVAGVGGNLMSGLSNMLGAGARPSYDTTPVGGVPLRGPDAFGPPAPAAGGVIGSTAAATLPGATPNGNTEAQNLAVLAAAAKAELDAAKAERDKEEASRMGGGGYSPGDRGGIYEMARGGTVSTRPLGGSGTALVTPERLRLVGDSGKVYGIVGEDNTDPGTAPNRELLTGVGTNRMQVTPLEPARMAGGGTVEEEDKDKPPESVGGFFGREFWDATHPQPGQNQDMTPRPQGGGGLLPNYVPGAAPQQPSFNSPQLQFSPGNWTAQPPAVPGAVMQLNPDGTYSYYDERGPVAMATGGEVYAPTNYPTSVAGIPQLLKIWQPQIPMPTRQPPEQEAFQEMLRRQAQQQMMQQQQGGAPRRFATGGEVNYMPPPAPATVNIDPGGLSNTTTGTPTTTFAASTPMDDPFGAALPPWQKAAQTLAMDDTNRQRLQYRRRAGGLGQETGIPVLQGQGEGRLMPGTYFDYKPQVNNMISELLSNQAQYRTLGPAEDVNPLYGRVGDIGVGLDRFNRIRDLEGQLPGLLATNELAQQQARTELATSQSQLNTALQMKQIADQNAAQYYLYSTPGSDPLTDSKLLAEQYAAQGKIDAINAQMTELQQAANGMSPALINLNARLDAERAALGDTNEAGLRTELALLNQRLSNQTKRVQLQNVATNLKAAGAPSLTAPLAV